MVFVLDSSGNPCKTPDSEQLNTTMHDKYGDNAFIFTADGYDFTKLEEIVKKVSKSLSLVFEPLSGYVLIKGNTPDRVYKRAVTTLKKQVKDIKVLQ